MFALACVGQMGGGGSYSCVGTAGNAKAERSASSSVSTCSAVKATAANVGSSVRECRDTTGGDSKGRVHSPTENQALPSRAAGGSRV